MEMKTMIKCAVAWPKATVPSFIGAEATIATA